MMKKLMTALVVLMLMVPSVGVLAEKLVVGTNAEFPPFEFFADDGSIQGFDAELIGAILALDGTEYEIISMEFDALPASLAADQIDIAIAGMTISEEKGKSVLFTEPYFNAAQKLIVLADSPIQQEADLKAGMKVGVQLGTTGDIYVTDNLPDVSCERYNKALDAVMDMKQGRLDAVMVDSAPSAYFAEAIEGLKVLAENLSDEQYGMAVKLGNAELAEKLNQGLKTIQENGTFDTIYEKYFGKIETQTE